MAKRLMILLTLSTVILCCILIIYQNYGYVENFSMINIEGPIEANLVEYKNNTLPFSIIKNSNDCQVYVNGKEYDGKERFYNIGEYKIVAKQGRKIERGTVNINSIEISNDNTYNIYVLPETLQVLIGNLDMSYNCKQKGFLWTSRTTTLDIEKVKANIPNMVMSNNMGVLPNDKRNETLQEEITEYIKEILKKNKNAYFKVFIMEDMFYYDADIFGKIGLNDDRYDITMYTDGTLGYVKKFELLENNKYDNFCEEKEKYFNLMDSFKRNEVESEILDTNILGKDDTMLISTLKKNIRLLIQFPDCRVFNDERINDEMKNANIDKLIVRDKFERLNDVEKDIFFDNINLNKEELDKEYFDDVNSKYLVITGTSPFLGGFNYEDNYKKVLEKVVQEYGDDYKILYKPHPRALPNENQEKLLEDLNIKILPRNNSNGSNMLCISKFKTRRL